MPAAALALSDQDRATLEAWTRASTVSAGQRERALIVLAIADGAGVSGAARSLRVSRPTVIKWRDRFVADGLCGLGTHRARQLPHPQARRHQPLAGEPPTHHAALHSNVGVLAKPHRGVLRDHHPPSNPTRLL